MSQRGTNSFSPFFLTGKNGNLFANYFPPKGTELGNILCVPPFAEEMNRCRAMMAMQARSLAEQGFGVLIIDLFGTGDSDGEFAEASWNAWKENVADAIEWFTQHEKNLVAVWGIRLGCLLVADLAAEGKLPVKHLLFWQPVINGKTMITQFLRIRIAAALNLPGNNETTDQMRQSVSEGSIVEVGGYGLSSEIIGPIDRLELGALLPDIDQQIHWFEQVSEPDQDLSFATQRLLLAQVDSSGAEVRPAPFCGPAFWQLHHRAIAEDLIELTSQSCVNLNHA